MGKLLSIKDLDVVFNTFDGISRVLRGINLEINESEALGLVGETGSGKSVLSQSIMRLLPVSGEIVSGSITFKGENLLGLSEKRMERLRGSGISMILQSPMTSLNPLFKVKDQMTEVIMTHSSIGKKEALKKAEELLKIVRVPEARSVLERYPFELSGGMAQRVMIAMAVSSNPALIIADEPTTALDVTVEKQIIKLMREIMEKSNSSLIWISHDLDVVKQVCERIAVMYGGTIVEIGDAKELLSNPLHPYTKALIEARPSSIKRGKPLKSIDGFVPNMLKVPEGCIFESRCADCSERCCKGLPPELIKLDNGRMVACNKFSDTKTV
ncbi:MAG: ABC transporter ATP-binding protein [Firmicutes bacterium]|nr:ABC transporter ATP-binding protein [Bacillota bacterium]